VAFWVAWQDRHCEAGANLTHNVHVMITSKNVVADRYDVVKSTGCCKEQHHGCKRKDNCSVVSLYRGIDAIHDATPVQATQASASA
jgi:hypothetical protein